MFEGAKKKLNNKGFTLIELIVVIAIIGILMTLSVPRLIGYQEAAKETADNQLMALYGNTFNVLLAQGKIKVPDGVTSEVTIVINKDGTFDYPDDSLEVRNTSGGYEKLKIGTGKGEVVDSGDLPTLYSLQAEYIAIGGKGDGGGANDIPQFGSKLLLDAGGAEVVITPSNTASVRIKGSVSPGGGSGD